MSYAKEDVKDQIELDDVFTLLEYFGAEPEIYNNYIVSYTICHGGDTKKLYYYDNTQLFKCYTGDCGSFDIFELVLKVKELQDLNSAIYFVVNFFNLQSKLNEVDESYDIEDWKIFSRYNKLNDITVEEQKKIELERFDYSVLKYLPRPTILDWLKEGINKDVCDYMKICYDAADGNILIPHYDENNNLVGIRQRTLVQENEKYGKYRPWKDNGKLYNHPLAFNLYGLNVAKDNIAAMQTAVVVESEKAVLQYISYFGTANDICVAVCGSSLSKYQFNLLKELGVRELIIAFDKDFQQIGDEDYAKTINKLMSIYHKYGSKINISFVFDKEGTRLRYKNSPLDCGRDTFLHLFRNRIYL